MKSLTKIISEILPLFVFFYLYKKFDIKIASLGLVISTIIALIIIYISEKTIPKATLISGALVSIFGLLTAFTGDSTFIKIKPTIIYISFSLLIFGFLIRKKYILKNILGTIFDLSDSLWKKLSITWGVFFLTLAIVNEIIWRNFSESFWVKFKVFGFIPITIIFLIAQIFIMSKYVKKNID